MKIKNYFPLMFVGLAITFTACSNESLLPEDNTEKNVISEKDAYMNFVSELETEYKGKTVYHNYNRPDYSTEIKQLLEKSIEITGEDEPTTRSVSGMSYGPWGGTSGYPFDARLTLYPGETWKKLSAIKIRAHKYIDAIQLYWVNDKGNASCSAQYGRDGGDEYWIFLAPNEYIIGANIKYAKLVDNLTLITNFNVHTFGGSGGKSTANLNFGISGYQLHGVYGRSDKFIDNIGFYCYPNSIFPVN